MNDQAKVDDLLDRWEDHWEQGEEIAVDDLCQESPELAQEVRFQIRALKGTNWLFEAKDDVCDFLTLPPLETMVHADTVSIPAAVSLDQFASCIVTSGLMTSEQLSQLQKQSAATNAQEFVNQLIRERKLTSYQAQAVVDGNTKGLVLGNYVILDRVGAGGMGQVFLAKHRIMKRVAALKVLPEAAVKSANAVERFHREVEAAARLKHPNIVTTYDADQANGLHFFVMEHIDGDDLSAVIRKRGRLSVAKTLDCIIQASRGLEYAHKQGVIHRDIKPGNLLLDAEGTVKILDMGLARLQTTSDTDRYAPTQAELTQDGSVFGTVDYMSPEQALNSKDVDGRADIYSLGCTLYNLLTGKPLYQGESLMGKMLAHRENEIPVLHEERTDVPERLSEIFAKMVAKKVEDRYPTMSSLLADLEALAADVVEENESETTMKDATMVPPSRIDLRSKETSSASIGDTVDYTVRVASKPAKPQPLSDGVPRRAWFAGRGVATVALAILGYLYFASVIFKVETPDGIIQVETNVTDIEVFVDGQKVVTITDPKDQKKVTVEVKPGAKTLSVSKDGFEAEVSSFTLKTVNGPINVTFVPKSSPSGDGDIDREVAEWVLQLNGELIVTTPNSNDKKKIRNRADLPQHRFYITDLILNGTRIPNDLSDAQAKQLRELKHLSAISFSGNPHMSDQTLERIDPLELELLRLERSAISDEGLRHIPSMIQLHIEDTNIGDDGFKHLSQLPSLSKIFAANTMVTDAGIKHFISHPLTYLELNGCSGITDETIQTLKTWPGLYSVDLANTRVTDAGVAELQKALPKCKIIRESLPPSDDPNQKISEWVIQHGGSVHVKPTKEYHFNITNVDAKTNLPPEPFFVDGINLKETDITDSDLLGQEELLRRLEGLREMYLSNTKITDDGLRCLAQVPHLEKLDISRTAITGTGLKYIKQIRDLAVENTKITDVDLADIKPLTHLRKLVLNRTQVTGSGFKHLADLTELEQLELSVTPVDPEAVQNLQSMKSLRRLRIHSSQFRSDHECLSELQKAIPCCRIEATRGVQWDVDSANWAIWLGGSASVATGRGEVVTADGIGRLPSWPFQLGGIDLTGSQYVTDESLWMLRELKSLTKLSLSGTGISDGAIEYLKPLTNLTELDLRETKFTAVGVAALQQALPNCKIIRESDQDQP